MWPGLGLLCACLLMAGRCASAVKASEANQSTGLMRSHVDAHGNIEQTAGSLLEAGAGLDAGDGSVSALNSALATASLVETQGASAEQSALEAAFRSSAKELQELHKTHISEMSYPQRKRMYELEDTINRAGRRWDDNTEQSYSWHEFKELHPWEHSWDVEVQWEELPPVDKMAKAAAKLRSLN
mmetsp:Transcript_73243/g.136878  ORF Transcript_73243/g.136878 Transcript_73243/m.136878 type:complete len:184 (+) Transcript_73243:69-620(+)